jgi:hypothetical protein
MKYVIEGEVLVTIMNYLENQPHKDVDYLMVNLKRVVPLEKILEEKQKQPEKEG